MTAFGLVMLGKLPFFLLFLFFAVVASLCLNPAVSLSLFNKINLKKIFRLLRQMSTRCSSAKALSFWREERSHWAERDRHND